MNKQNSASITATDNRPEHNTLIETTQPLTDCVKIQSRLFDTFSILMQENWLPHGLRSLVVEELNEIKRELEEALPNTKTIACHVHSIALTTYAYPELVLKSKTVTHLRVWDLEMTPFSTLQQSTENSISHAKKVS